MLLSPQDDGTRQYHPSSWDQRLHDGLFAWMTAIGAVFGHHFSTVLDSMTMVYQPDSHWRPATTLRGTYRLWLSEAEYCDLPVTVVFGDSDAAGDASVDQFRLGSFNFVGDSASVERVSLPPALLIVVRNADEREKHVARMFVNAKAAGIAGVRMSWTVMLNDLAELSADEVWPRDPTARTRPYAASGRVAPGWQTFALQNLSFEVAI